MPRVKYFYTLWWPSTTCMLYPRNLDSFISIKTSIKESAFFDASLYADEAIQIARVEHTGGTWPPQGVEVFNPWHLPLINTIILLTSGTTVTWAHHALKENKRGGLIWGLVLTVLLGVCFTAVQAYEYGHAWPYS